MNEEKNLEYVEKLEAENDVLKEQLAELKQKNKAFNEQPILYHLNPTSAANTCKEAIDRAAESGRFLVAVWAMEGDELRLTRTTWKFPTDQYEPAIEKLRSNIEEERKPHIRPLPMGKLRTPNFITRVPGKKSDPMPDGHAHMLPEQVHRQSHGLEPIPVTEPPAPDETTAHETGGDSCEG
jgi:hypothetical protein